MRPHATRGAASTACTRRSWRSGAPAPPRRWVDPEETARQPQGDSLGPASHQATRARVASQGQGSGRDGGAVGAVKKTRGDLPQGRGRMIGLEDRQRTAQWIAAAHRDGARLHKACEVAGIDVRRQSRWLASSCPAALSPPAPRTPQLASAEISSSSAHLTGWEVLYFWFETAQLYVRSQRFFRTFLIIIVTKPKAVLQ